MATSNSETISKGSPGGDIGVYVSNFLPGNCPPDAVDPRVLLCETDSGCEWAETCEDEDLVCINDVWYYTWRPKGLKDDFCPLPKDKGKHIHLSCSPDQTGIRITGDDIVTILEELCDDGLISRFCDWIFNNCLNTAQYTQWVCDTIVGNCFADSNFIDEFCQWFIFSIFNNQKFIDAFVNWVLTNILTEPTLINQLCDIFESCIDTDLNVRGKICEVVEECFLTSTLVRNEVCNIVETDCLSDTLTQDIICGIVKDYCITTDTWNVNTDTDPAGTPANAWYMIESTTGCVSHICIANTWVCLGGPITP